MAAGRVLSKVFRKNFQNAGRNCLFYRSFSNTNEKTTHFGYETVSEEEKTQKVHHVFHNVAEKYDLMNDLMSAGIHRAWKNYFIRKMKPSCGHKLLDVAGGTGDIAMRYLNYIKHERRRLSKYTGIIVCDVNQAMLDVGKKKAEKFGVTAEISWVCCDGEDLPFDDNSFDVYTIAFGLRNFTNIEKALKEAYRVLAPGGRFLCLEFSALQSPWLQRLYDTYSFQVIPVMGEIVAKDWNSYQYLVESIRQFPNQDQFMSLIRNTGFRMVNYENLTFGVAAIHSGFKL